MKTLREAVRDIINDRILPWVERDGIGKLFLPEQITDADCVKEPRCDRPYDPGHRERDLVIGLAGRTPYCIEKKPFVFTPGRIVLMPAGTPHTAVQTTWYRTMDFDPDWSRSIMFLTVYPFGVRVQVFHVMPEADTIESTQPYVLLGRNFSRLTNDLLEEVRSKPPDYAGVGRCLLMEFLHRCARATAVSADVDALMVPRRLRSGLPDSAGRKQTSQRRPRKGAASKSSKTASERFAVRVETARRFIHSNYSDSITMEDISAAADTSADHLGRQFKAAVGVTPIQYLANVRMSIAAELLMTDLMVSEVARMVGIDDPSYFGRLFRRINGANPTAYRRRMAKAANQAPSVRK